MYGTRGRQILMHDDLAPDYAAALARAYNNWAHDYCQSQPQRLTLAIVVRPIVVGTRQRRRVVRREVVMHQDLPAARAVHDGDVEIGRASCRERVEISVSAGSLKKKE